MSINYLELYKSMYKTVSEEHLYNKVFLIFEATGLKNFTHITLITSEKGVKKSPNYGWTSLEKAQNYINNQKETAERHQQNIALLKEKRKEDAKNFLEKLKEGDILSGAWGYEAIWHDFYKVVGKQGSFVLLKEMKKKVTDDECKYGACSYGVVTCGDDFANDKIIKRKVQDGYIKINEYTNVTLWDGKAREEGCWH